MRPADGRDLTMMRPRPAQDHDIGWLAFTAVAGFGVTFFRDPSAWRSVWAEDGQVFLAGAVSHGLGSFFHFYAGYMHVVPRTGALVASWLPLSVAPLVMTSFAVAVVSGCGAAVENLSGAYVRARWARVALGLAYGFLPAIRVEAIANLANLQFFLVPTAFWVLLVVPRTRAGTALGALFLLATASSTVLGFVLFPVAVARLVGRRQRLGPALYLGTESLHILAALLVGQGRPRTVAIPFHDVVTHFLYNVFGGQFFGGPFYYLRHPLLTMVAIGVAAVACAALLAYDRPRDVRGPVVVAVAAAITGCSTYFIEAVTQGAPSRYAVAPAFLVVFAVGITADLAWRQGAARAVTSIAVVAVLSSWAISFPAAPYRHDGPRWAQEYRQAQQTCRDSKLVTVELPILPLRPSPALSWTMALPCSALR